MRWIKKQLRFIMLGFFLLTNGVIVTEASLSGAPSGVRSNLVTLFLSIFVNRTLPSVEHTEVLMEEMTVTDNNGQVINPAMTYFIPLGVTRRMNVLILPETTTDQSVSWQTSNKEVLEVYPGGYLEARSLGENVRVTATPSDESKALSFYVTVHEKLAPPSFSGTLRTSTIDVGTTTTLDINLTTQQAREYDPSKLVFKSSNESVATVNNYGVIKGLSPGSTSISVVGHEASYPLTVTNPLTPVILAESITLTAPKDGYVYDKTPLNITFDKNNVTDQSVTVVSNNPAIATIIKEDNNYFIYGNKVAGTTLISVYYNTDFLVAAHHEIRMHNVLPTTLFLSANKAEAALGSIITLTTTLSHNIVTNDADVPVTDQRIIYASSDESIATVSTNNLIGRVLGHKVGTVTVRATSLANPDISATITLKIIPTPFINDGNYGSFQAFVRKAVGHFFLFAVNGFFGFWTFYLWLKEKRLKRTIIYSLAIGLFSAVLSEFIQLFVPGRAGSVVDVLIDFAGYLSITLILFAIMYFREKRNPKKVAPVPLPPHL